MSISDKGKRDLRISTCKICGCGIFERQQRVWSTDPLGLGLVHIGCVRVPAVKL